MVCQGEIERFILGYSFIEGPACVVMKKVVPVIALKDLPQWLTLILRCSFSPGVGLLTSLSHTNTVAFLERRINLQIQMYIAKNFVTGYFYSEETFFRAEIYPNTNHSRGK